jgi:aerobic-type carbon monoxide dehydrogenase small subunit (CoxS/CutS family)
VTERRPEAGTAVLTVNGQAGQIMSAVKLLEEGHAGDDGEIAEWMSGNICRCAAYPNIRGRDPRVREAAGVNGDAAVSG